MPDTPYADVILAGGGLSAGLIALALRARRPSLRVLVIERLASVGAGHTWSCFETDIAPEDRDWIGRLADHRWPGYSVNFPALTRSLTTSYQTLSDLGLHAAVAKALGPDLIVGATVAEVERDRVQLVDGRSWRAAAVIDARGPSRSAALRLGYQKFVGLEVETEAPHGVRAPVIMDADVHQTDGYRFLYLLPFSPTRILIEDTRYADGEALDARVVAGDARAYAHARGWRIARETRCEEGVLPVALGGDIDAFWNEAERASPAAPVGLRAALFHPTTGYSLPDAVRTARLVADLPALTTASVHHAVKATSLAAWEARGFYRLLDRMLFHAAAPALRYKVLQRFHRLPQPLIERFYAARSTSADKLRILCGRPPVPLRSALACLPEPRTAEAA